MSSGSRTVGICAVVLAGFAALSLAAARAKNATVDEPLHAAAGWLQVYRGNFALDMQNPPLAKYLAGLAAGPATVRGEFDARAWQYARGGTRTPREWLNEAYFTGPGFGEAAVGRARLPFVAVGVATAALAALWAYRLAGSVAAVVAAVVFCLDPTVLAHSAVVKTDVPIAFWFLLAFYALWRVSRRVTAADVAILGVAVGAALATKVTAVLLPPVVVAVVAARALVPVTWPVLRTSAAARGRKVVACAAVIASVGVLSYATLWAAYGFRFAPSGDPAVTFDVPRILDAVGTRELRARFPGRALTRRDLRREWQPGPSLNAAVFLYDHRLLPSAWLAGFMVQQGALNNWPTFVLGQLRREAVWWYYPFAMIVKEPLPLLCIWAAAGVVLVARGRRSLALWPLVLAVAGYGLVEMFAGINIGIRHLLAVYPMIAVLSGVAAAVCYAIRPKATRLALVAAFVLLAADVAFAFPNYIAYFNQPARAYGPIRLLGDSNLDWGQDLKTLAAWQKAHPAEKLYLCYFGGSNPAAFDLRYTGLAGSWTPSNGASPDSPGILAISATHLQGMYLDEQLRRIYAKYLDEKPVETLGGSIYLFRYRGKDPPVESGGATWHGDGDRLE